MDYETIIQELHDLASGLSIRIRYEKGDFDGGYCILHEERLIVVNRKLSSQRKAAVIALSIHEFGLENVYLRPALRDFIEDEVAKVRRGAAA
jgi:hypothetical protein